MRKVANQRHDWSHKVAAQIVSSNSLVATKKLTPKVPPLASLTGMTRKGKGKRKRQKAGLNRSLLDVAIGMTKDAIKYKVIEAKGVYLEAPTQKLKPTQRCAKCWETTKKTGLTFQACAPGKPFGRHARKVNKLRPCSCLSILPASRR